MRWLELLTLILYSDLNLTVAECPGDVIDAIEAYWDGNPPTDVLESQVGTMTYVWMSESFLRDKLDAGLHCFATDLSVDMTSTTDMFIYRNRTPVADEVNYYQTEKDGVIFLHSHKVPEDLQLVISHQDHVSTFWQCKESEEGGYEPFVGISVDMAYLDTEAAMVAVEEGIRTLDELFLNDGVPLTPCTPDVLEYNLVYEEPLPP